MANKSDKENLRKYLTAVAQDATVRHAHLTNPEETMKRFKLSEKHREMIMYGDVTGIQKEIGNDSVLVVVTTHTNNCFKK